MSKSSGQAKSSVLPNDAQTVKQLLESMGVTEYEPRVLNQLVDFVYKYTAEVLQEAEAIGGRSGTPRGEVSVHDVMLAVQCKARHSFVPPPSLQMLQELAEAYNKQPLPELKARHGLRLPPEADCLIAPNYQLGGAAQRQPPAAEGVAAQAMDVDQGGPAAQPPPARRDHRISVNVEEGWQPAAAQPAGAPDGQAEATWLAVPGRGGAAPP